MDRCIAAGLIGVIAVGGAQAADAPGCRYVKVAELSLKFENNRPLVKAEVNGRPAWFIVDTGSDSTDMFGGAARAFGLSETTADGMRFYGIGGGQTAKYATVANFGIGDAMVKNVRFFTIGAGGSPDRAGLLGRDFFDALGDMEFDLAAGALRLWKAQNCPANRSLAYWTKEPHTADLVHDEQQDPYFIRIRLNRAEVKAELDSGAFTSIATPAAARRAGVVASDYDKSVAKVGGIGDQLIDSRIATFQSIAIGDEEIKHARLRVADMFSRNTETRTGSILPQRVEMEEPDMLLGADFLRSHRVLIAKSQRLLYFTYSGGPVFQVVGDAVKPAETAAAPKP
jgi:predicted aspartyl protease